jgi:hypothetical protein
METANISGLNNFGKYSYGAGESKMAAQPLAVAQKSAVDAPEEHGWLYNLLNGPGLPSPYACMKDPAKAPSLTDTLKDGGTIPMSQPNVRNDAGQIDPTQVNKIIDGGTAYMTESGAVIILPPPPQAPDTGVVVKPAVDAGPAIDSPGREAGPDIDSLIEEVNPAIDAISPEVNSKTDLAPAAVIPDAQAIDPNTAVVILPLTDAGSPRLPDDVWFEITGTGTFFQATPAIILDSQFASSGGLQNLPLAVFIGTDSTMIPGMPANGCFYGMVKTNKLSPADIANNFSGCPDPGFTSFVDCPGSKNDLNIYLAGYTLKGYKYVNGQWTLPADNIINSPLTDPAALFQDLSQGILLGSLCGVAGTAPNPYQIMVPPQFYSDGMLKIEVSFNLITDARGKDPAANFETTVIARIALAKNNPVDGGTAPADGGTNDK